MSTSVCGAVRFPLTGVSARLSLLAPLIPILPPAARGGTSSNVGTSILKPGNALREDTVGDVAAGKRAERGEDDLVGIGAPSAVVGVIAGQRNSAVTPQRAESAAPAIHFGMTVHIVHIEPPAMWKGAVAVA